MPSADSSPAQPTLHIYASLAQADIAAAQAVAAAMRRVIAARGRASAIFASDLSEIFFDELVKAESVEWTRVIAFHTEEGIGLAEDAPQSARNHLIKHLIGRVPIAEFHGLRGEAANPRAVCENYAAMLASRPPDLAVLRLGANGRVGLLDLDEPSESATVKVVTAAQHALSLTAQAFAGCASLFVIAEQAQAARRLLENPAPNLFSQAQFFAGR